MKVIDLTQTITEDMPVYPGTERPKLTIATTFEEHGFKETLLSMFSHTGTHMDAPHHMFADRTKLDVFPVDGFVGTALVIDCSMLNEGDVITMDLINKAGDKADKAEFILFYTGWDKYWNTDKYFGRFPYLSEETARYIVDTKKKGVGIDTISIDSISDTNTKSHKIILKNAEAVIVENLTNLHVIGGELFRFIALPLKFKNSDGAPVRAIAILEDKSK